MLKKTCPSCHTQTSYGEHPHFPFCSARCRNADLAAWSDEKHKISTPIQDADNATSDMNGLEFED